MVIVPSRKSIVKIQLGILPSSRFFPSEDDESPPMRSFGRLCGRRSTVPEGVESELSVSEDGDNVGSDDGHASGVQWSGIVEENSDEGW